MGVRGISLLLVLLGAGGPLVAQGTQGVGPARSELITAAREIMQAARYCTFVTNGPGGQPQARIVDPFVPDADLTIWIATNPLTRKVAEIRKDRRVTLLYFNAATSEYVTVLGTVQLDTDARHKAEHWKPEWSALYTDQNRGVDYQLLRVKPRRLEVVSVQRGINTDPKTWRPAFVDVP